MLRLVSIVLVWLATCEIAAAACPPHQHLVNGKCVPIQKSAKECRAEWRANNADNLARGISERAYVKQCRFGGSTAAAPTGPAPELPCCSSPTVGTSAGTGPGAGHPHFHRGGSPSGNPIFRELVPVRAYLRATDIAPKNVAAYGVVAFRAKPTPATRDRLRMACISYTKTLARQVDLPSTVSPEDQMLTIWPLDDPTNKQAAADNCDFVIDHYELYGGDSAIEDALRQGAVLGDSGPFLIGWSPSNTRGIPDKLVLTVDMSGFDSQQSFDQAFLFWKKKVVDDPTLWRGGFRSEELRLSIRDFVDQYGEAILAAVTLWKKE